MAKVSAARKLKFKGDMKHLFDDMVERYLNDLVGEHGGWDETDIKDAMFQFKLGEDAVAGLVRDGFIEYLQTPEGLEAVKSVHRPWWDAAMRVLGEDEGEDDEG